MGVVFSPEARSLTEAVSIKVVEGYADDVVVVPRPPVDTIDLIVSPPPSTKPKVSSACNRCKCPLDERKGLLKGKGRYCHYTKAWYCTQSVHRTALWLGALLSLCSLCVLSVFSLCALAFLLLWPLWPLWPLVPLCSVAHLSSAWLCPAVLRVNECGCVDETATRHVPLEPNIGDTVAHPLRLGLEGAQGVQCGQGVPDVDLFSTAVLPLRHQREHLCEGTRPCTQPRRVPYPD